MFPNTVIFHKNRTCYLKRALSENDINIIPNLPFHVEPVVFLTKNEKK